MKISDFENYKIPQEESKYKVEIFKKSDRASVFAVAAQTTVDLPIVLLVRSIIIVFIVKFFTQRLPAEAFEKIQTAINYGSSKELIMVAMSYNIHVYIFYGLLFAFMIGSFYYIFLLKYCKRGTLGMVISRTIPQTKNGEKPTILQATLWYYLKTVYPICITIAFLIFLKKGMNGLSVFLFFLAVPFSSIFTITFGFSPLYEKFSNIKIINKK